MGKRVSQEVRREWPIIGIALLLWFVTIVLRTPQVGIDLSRVAAISVSSCAMVTIGIHWERLQRARAQDKEDRQ